MGAVGTLASSRYIELPAGPSIVLAGAVLFTASMLSAPRRGLISGIWSEHRFRVRIAEQRLLNTLYELYEASGERSFSADQLLASLSWKPRQLKAVLRRLGRQRLIIVVDGNYGLTEAGLQRSAQAARAARLWELYLLEHAEGAAAVAHLDRETLDEHLPAEMISELESKLRASGRLPEV